MITDQRFAVLKKAAWLLFFVMLTLNLVNTALVAHKSFWTRGLPFELDSISATQISDPQLAATLANAVILKVDTLDLVEVETAIESSLDTLKSKSPLKFNRSGHKFNLHFSPGGDDKSADKTEKASDKIIRKYIADKDSLEITYRDTISSDIATMTVHTVSKANPKGLLKIIYPVLLILFVYFNSFLLLRFSQNRENLLIVFFLICLATPSLENLPVEFLTKIWRYLLSPFWGILFYHFMTLKVAPQTNLLRLYRNSFIIFTVALVCSFFDAVDFVVIACYFWPLFWLVKALLLFRKEYKQRPSIDLKRLLNAFRGILISAGAAGIAFILLVVMAILIPGAAALVKSDLLTQILSIGLGSIFVLALLTVFIGILWFFASFTWSLLTGTGLDIKIRSSLIYTIVGVFFVTIFGFIDYVLGELLQSLFGNFMGSQFVGGIPATIALLALFTPIRTRVEKYVDQRLNSSDLDFLERTDTFTQNLSEEGVVEGFEEYICENLIQLLPIEKVALISFDNVMDAFKFNEIRGSEVIENSRVSDSQKLLNGKLLLRGYDSLSDDPQDMASFPLIIPIMFDEEHRWFMALGRKTTGEIYNKNDIKSLTILVEKIRLSLKFILVYEEILTGKYEKTLEEKDRLIAELKSKSAGQP